MICNAITQCTAVKFFDQDGSGTITRQEMKEQFAELGGLLSDDEIDQFHEILDVDGNGVIDVRPAACMLAVRLASGFVLSPPHFRALSAACGVCSTTSSSRRSRRALRRRACLRTPQTLQRRRGARARRVRRTSATGRGSGARPWTCRMH